MFSERLSIFPLLPWDSYPRYEDSAIAPTFDIPPEYIDQSSREFKFYSNTSTDDHGVHLVGYAKIDKLNWFLIKDSAKKSKMGKVRRILLLQGRLYKTENALFYDSQRCS